MTPPDDVRAVRAAFLAAGYTPDGVHALLGDTAHLALGRRETVPADRATRGGSALETLVRLFALQLPVAPTAARAALPSCALTEQLVRHDADGVHAVVDVRPYGESDGDPWWVVSDLGTGYDGVAVPLGLDHVVGVGGASTTLAQLTLRTPVGRALDLGTGSGVQSLHLSRHAAQVVATDLSPRAVRLAALTATLSGVVVDVRVGDLFAPVDGERFDLVVSNPPFVMDPAGGYTYRAAGSDADALCATLLAAAPAHLAEGGWCQVLASWVHRRGQPWQDRVAAWVDGSGCDAWVVQREVADPAEYVELWLRDSGEVGGPGYRDRYDAWLGALEASDVEGVGYGWVVLHDGGAQRPSVVVEDLRQPLPQPVWPAVAATFAARAWLRDVDDDTLLAARLVRADGVVQEQHGTPGADDPERVVLRQREGMGRSRVVDTVAAALVGACEAGLPTGTILDAVASLLGVDAATVRRDAVATVRELVADGWLGPVAEDG